MRRRISKRKSRTIADEASRRGYDRSNIEQVFPLLENLTGQRVPLIENKAKLRNHKPFDRGGMGHSQLNEVLLTLGYDRVGNDFFCYLFGEDSTVKTLQEFEIGIDKFRKDAILLFGNVKFGFKTFSNMDEAELTQVLAPIRSLPPKIYESRHETLHKIQTISPEDAYYLGYIIENRVKEQLAKTPTDEDLKARVQRTDEIKPIARQNHDTYLTYDHMDVYIATSMREKHEFQIIREFIRHLFSQNELKPLKLRYFDPTQAYCKDRIDKGLVEGLMVKRAKCTIYHVQEADTFGKDSELAATLAQGKPVIAFIPQLKNSAEFIGIARLMASTLYKEFTFKQLILEKFLPLYYPEGAWKDPLVQGWVTGRKPFKQREAEELLFKKARAMYEKRATTLCDAHPLGLQVNLDTGVSNGVLVVRTVKDCARLLRNIMLNEMEFDLEKNEDDGKVAWYLRERISRCIYRVVTGDDLLTNSFWNFYLKTPSFYNLT